jgi:Holliday junction DNA helicase RuvB
MEIFRPKYLKDIVGQCNIKKFLTITIDASNKKNKPIPHLLFIGKSGGGKTSFAKTISYERNVPVQTANGSKLNGAKYIVPYLVKAKPNSILFIDEIHRLPIKTQEFIYPVLEEGKLYLSTEHSTSELQLNDFTIIGASTNIGLLAEPFRNRFAHHLALEEYTYEQLETIAEKNLKKVERSASVDSIKLLSKICKSTPRTLNNHINWLNDYCISHNIASIDTSLVQKAMNILGIDENGLNEYDKKYLNLLKEQYGEPIGLKSIASLLDLDIETIENSIEPFLIKERLIQKTSTGRIYIGDGNIDLIFSFKE